MVKPLYLFFAFVAMLCMLAVMVAFVVAPDSGPWDRGDADTIQSPPVVDIVE